MATPPINQGWGIAELSPTHHNHTKKKRDEGWEATTQS